MPVMGLLTPSPIPVVGLPPMDETIPVAPRIPEAVTTLPPAPAVPSLPAPVATRPEEVPGGRRPWLVRRAA